MKAQRFTNVDGLVDYRPVQEHSERQGLSWLLLAIALRLMFVLGFAAGAAA